MDNQHDIFAQCAQTQGIQINKIAPARFAGRGTGIVCTSAIKAGEQLGFVPTALLITTSTAHEDARLQETLIAGKISVHGLLAASLCLQNGRAHAPSSSWLQTWRAVWPSKEDMTQAMPLLWPPALRRLLPPLSQEIVREQRRKLDRDFAAAVIVLPNEVGRDDYEYHWLLVNTRTFYHVTDRTRDLPAADRMALCPYLDYFNHADTEPDQEVCISYGPHTSDFLLAEYGFVPDKNEWDDLRLDHLILPRVSDQQRARLESAGYLGDYALVRRSPCHRTEVALRLLVGPVGAWQQFVDGQRSGVDDEKIVNACLADLLKIFKEEVDTVMKVLTSLEQRTPQELLLQRRWTQIHLSIDNAARTVTADGADGAEDRQDLIAGN
ncbi:MAG: hypothetical protein M1826_001148 [Phylliscum demangeonii]|nr:MAG: hypothetical protein M1826_001148 [Phylliscum demangeonii]